MKTLEELFEIIAKAVARSRKTYRTLFVEYHGHIEQIGFRYYLTGWKDDSLDIANRAEFKLDEDGIQAAYWWIKSITLS
jgi:hypothetical protein